MPVEEKHGRGVEQARRMLDTFASVGVNAFDITETDIDGHKHSFRACRSVEQLRGRMAYLIQSATGRQHNICHFTDGRVRAAAKRGVSQI